MLTRPTDAFRYYLSLSADFGFLEENVEGRTVLEVMTSFATAYKNLTYSGHSGGGGEAGEALADYGLAANLLECVPTYQHRVASFNAASVWMLEQLAVRFSRLLLL